MYRYSMLEMENSRKRTMGGEEEYENDNQEGDRVSSVPADYTDYTKTHRSSRKWDLVAFWIFGLCNNFAYVVMLSAAHDILDDGENKKGGNSTAGNMTTLAPPINIRDEPKEDTVLECNRISTGAVLLADILPTMFVKMLFPFFLQNIPYWLKISMISFFGLVSFITVAFAHEFWLSIIGIVFASIGAGLGEITFLSLTTFYHRNVVSMWSSGTGGAGVLGALIYAAFTSAGLSPRTSLLIMTAVPVLMMVTYFFILKDPVIPEVDVDASDGTLLLDEHRNKKKIQLTLREKFSLMPSLVKYMLPLSLVYFAEYFINQGLHELLYFNGQWISKKEQYRWFQVDYQIGVFISRSSVNIIHIQKLWIMPVLQFVNMALLICQVFYRFIPSIWIIFAIVLWEGMLGGAAYVNTFYRMTNELRSEHKEYCIGVATLGDSIGIAVAGAVAIPSHNHICDLKLKM